ncbi:hypothetical protein OZN62_09480 [Aurantiacibacter sp. MUD11]|uniref:hypothetical protein n=1 Tax=Aurantiacibacter sp. MUD11 TaxID=3003265 RepID=UPI0022AAFA41|nr:hypothetical protein [Aurantiacibacter sp. MUD11]WAT17163.1 hypothetical protein OZN62_09480 [Aurantiacibacter sp. MUD11]
MTRINRRSTLQLAMVAAVAPLVGSSRAAATVPDRLIAPPATPMRYVRTVSREMAGGAHFTVTREFTVEFRQFAGGFMLHGNQLAAAVDAPAQLAHFARLEESRDESAIFPLALDPFGRILSTEIAPPAGEEVRLAVEEALTDLASQPIAEDERAQLSQFIAALQGASRRVTAHLPADLFAPASTPRREEQRIALPGGAEGRVETSFAGERDGQTGLMRVAARNVVTVVADSSNRVHEEWRLSGS